MRRQSISHLIQETGSRDRWREEEDDADGGGGCSTVDVERERERGGTAFLGNEDGHYGNCSWESHNAEEWESETGWVRGWGLASRRWRRREKRWSRGEEIKRRDRDEEKEKWWEVEKMTCNVKVEKDKTQNHKCKLCVCYYFFLKPLDCSYVMWGLSEWLSQDYKTPGEWEQIVDGATYDFSPSYLMADAHCDVNKHTRLFLICDHFVGFSCLCFIHAYVFLFVVCGWCTACAWTSAARLQVYLTYMNFVDLEFCAIQFFIWISYPVCAIFGQLKLIKRLSIYLVTVLAQSIHWSRFVMYQVS